ncbi:hypothetical protein M0802_003382 [Mischocyttarus mexicanus]|nr:hypothetical protein M0802_003382 [Mischocyttarus mexicanus]
MAQLVERREEQRQHWQQPMTQSSTRRLSIRHCQLAQCHEHPRWRRTIMRVKNDPRKALAFLSFIPPREVLKCICDERLEKRDIRHAKARNLKKKKLVVVVLVVVIVVVVVTKWVSSESPGEHEGGSWLAMRQIIPAGQRTRCIAGDYVAVSTRMQRDDEHM